MVVGGCVGLLLSGCVVAQPRPMVVATPPPPPPVQAEVVPVPPAPGYIWVAGHWAWRGRNYVWVPGHYAVPAQPGYVWVAPHWAPRGGGWVWVGDSVVAKPRLEPLTTLAYLAGITTRVRLGTAVLLPALRHPVVLAHQIANVDQISRGRVVLGLGVGWSLPSAEREWAACGADHKRRVRRLEEHVETWRALWRGEPLTRMRDDFTLAEHTIGPLPWTD